MTRVKCTSEDQQLQTILEQNPNLLPGEQIDPENPRRWLLVKREMPVPDPTSGVCRWSIDFLFGDQDAVPTLDECKRNGDTRGRREIIGQMLEYAANGAHYWTKDDLQQHALGSSTNDLATCIQSVTQDPDAEPGDYFERMHQNLRNGRLRLVFFLEDSSFELRSIVEFLNRQTDQLEVLIVEARQYITEGITVVAPMLYGFTDTARIAKQESAERSTTRSNRGRTRWNRDNFLRDIAEKVGQQASDILAKYLDRAVALGYRLTWGTGTTRGSVSFVEPAQSQSSIFMISSDGTLSLHYAWLADPLGQRVKAIFERETGYKVDEMNLSKFPQFSYAKWADHQDAISVLLEEVATCEAHQA